MYDLADRITAIKGNGVDSLIFLLMTYFFSFVHETGHWLCAKAFGYRKIRMKIGVFGSVLEISNVYINPFHKILILIAGPAVNICLATIFYLSIKGQGSMALYPLFALYSNILLAAFNLLPVFPLDGGRVIAQYMAFFVGEDLSYRIAVFFSYSFSLFLFLLGIYLVQYNPMNLYITALSIFFMATLKKERSI